MNKLSSTSKLQVGKVCLKYFIHAIRRMFKRWMKFREVRNFCYKLFMFKTKSTLKRQWNLSGGKWNRKIRISSSWVTAITKFQSNLQKTQPHTCQAVSGNSTKKESQTTMRTINSWPPLVLQTSIQHKKSSILQQINNLRISSESS